MYAKGKLNYQYAFFLDNIYGQTWDMTDSELFTVTTAGVLRWFIIQGSSLKDLRKEYMRLVGAPKVPPVEYLGFQHSMFGFRSFEDMFQNIRKVREENIPQDGMVLDL